MAKKKIIRDVSLVSRSRVVFPVRITKKKELTALYDQKINTAQTCAKILYKYGAKRVWLFGSLAKGKDIHRLTDIDIAVEGLKKPALDRARRTIQSTINTKIDVVCLETAVPGFRNAILKSRVLLNK